LAPKLCNPLPSSATPHDDERDDADADDAEHDADERLTTANVDKMLTIDAASACDVCSNAYGPTLLPYSIPCGTSLPKNHLVVSAHLDTL
jgi:hypothetical protein